MEMPPEYLQLIKDVFDSVERVIDGKRCSPGYINRDDFFAACLADIQVQALMEETAFKQFDPKSNQEKIETIRQALYRLSAETRAVICWLDVVKFFSCPTYKLYLSVTQRRRLGRKSMEVHVGQ